MTNDVAHRVEAAIRTVLPRTTTVYLDTFADPFVQVKINGRPLRAYWLGEGWPRQVKTALTLLGHHLPDIFVARRMSPGARAESLKAGVGWIDESGAAEISLDWLVIARTGCQLPYERPLKWTPSVMGVAEAILTGTKPTVADTVQATGLSVDTCTRALAFFTERGLLTAQARRGPDSARRLIDPDRLLDEYADAAASMPRVELRVGLLWSDPINGVAGLGRCWDAAGTKWAATGALAAAVLAPLLTDFGTVEVFVDGKTRGDLVRAAEIASARPMEGGRLVLRPFTSPATDRLSTRVDGLRVVPWPRIYADLRPLGVRGEDAAEHLREIMHAR